MRRRPFASGSIELIGAHFDEGGEVPVVGPVENESGLPPRARPRETESEIVGLASRVHEEDDLERRRQSDVSLSARSTMRG